MLMPSDLKTILHSKRANIYYLQYCRVLVNGGRVEYVTDEGKDSLYWNIPIANTTVVMLGTGTSITQAAMREFARAGVLVGFCGGAAHRFMQVLRSISMFHGLPRKVNIVRRSIYNAGYHSGLTTRNGLRQQSVFKQFA